MYDHRQTPAAAPAGQDPGEQRSAAATRLHAADPAIGVGSELRPVPLELRPIDVALVVPLQQHLPRFERPAVAVALARATIHDRRALLAFAVDVSPCVEGVRQHGDHVAVADRRPLERGHPLAVGGAWEVEPVGRQRQQHLPGAAQLAEPREDQPDRLLKPQIGIEAEAYLAMPDVADRHDDAQLAPTRLGAGGIEHAGAQHPELELADAALHAQEQPVVRPAGVVHAIKVDHPRLDEPAELQQVMPVTPIAGEPRGVQAQHGPDLAGAEPRHQPLEARPRDHAARGAAEIVVDDLDVPEAPASRQVDQLVLPTPALEVGLDLCWRRLPDVDHRLALQHGGRKRISAGHRHASPQRGRRPPSGDWPAVPQPRRARLRSSPAASRSPAPCSAGEVSWMAVPVSAGSP